ncbi:hypothetical protein [Nonomuraea guangzhouensis]|uniref:Uncharacterized protein n=1 Tax=Nonomuraea guangzhouensis TaxID=1291555 RepID=A0ABW4GNG4_9ACTN|nr:hypothetical protein [Nonomuraea guangzhouensis]
MSESFAAAVRERARRAGAALEAARRSGDAEDLMRAEGEWDDAQRFARRHGVPLDVEASDPEEGSAL